MGLPRTSVWGPQGSAGGGAQGCRAVLLGVSLWAAAPTQPRPPAPERSCPRFCAQCQPPVVLGRRLLLSAPKRIVRVELLQHLQQPLSNPRPRGPESRISAAAPRPPAGLPCSAPNGEGLQPCPGHCWRDGLPPPAGAEGTICGRGTFGVPASPALPPLTDPGGSTPPSREKPGVPGWAFLYFQQMRTPATGRWRAGRQPRGAGGRHV